MNRKNRKWITLIILLIAFGTTFWFKRFSFAKYYYMKNFFKKSPDSLIRKFEKEINEDREILSRYELFYESSGEVDAGPFLNPKVRWEIGPIPHQGELTLPQVIHRELAQDWTFKKPLFKKLNLNFGWMKELLTYDVWSLEIESPAYPFGHEFDTFTYPIPTYKDLITWSKLRYLYGRESGDIQSALIEVRHLMRLIWTNDNFVAAMTVLTLLKTENQFVETLDPKDLKDWTPVPLDHIMRASRYFHSLPAFSDIRLRDETFYKYTTPSPGKCYGINESLSVYLSMRDYLSKELKYGMDRMTELVKNTRCRKSYVINNWSQAHSLLREVPSGVTVLGQSLTEEDIRNDQDLKVSVGFIQANLMTWSHFSYEDTHN